MAGTTKDQLARACQIGIERHEIAADVGLQRLSKAAWLAQAAELAGGSGTDLAELRARVEVLPYLDRVVHGTVGHWQRTGQDRPVSDGIFRNGDGDYAASYAERIVAKLTAEQCSAVVAAILVETAPAAFFGRLESFAQVPALLEPLERELLELDAQLGVDVRDVIWRDGGKPTLECGGVTVEIGQGNAGRLASAFADAAAARHATTARAEAA